MKAYIDGKQVAASSSGTIKRICGGSRENAQADGECLEYSR